MPASREDEDRESRLAACLASVAMVSGIILCGVSMAALRSGAIYLIDKLVTFDTAWHSKSEDAPVVLTTRKVYDSLIVVGLMVVVAASLGILGALSRNRHLVCTYVVLATFFTVVTLSAGVYTLQRRSLVEPMMQRQITDLCNSTTYIRLATSIPCHFAAYYAPSEVTPCGVYCKYRARLLKQLQGCLVMRRLCQQFFYEELPSQGQGCAREIGEPGSMSMMYMASESSEVCRELCDQDIRCTAYAYSGPSAFKPERCLLGQGVASQHLPPRWSPVHPSEAAEYLAGGSSLSCFRRGAPVLLHKFRDHGLRLAVCILLLGASLLASTVISCCLMYNVNFKRRDLPQAAELAFMMCCPCCAWETHKRYYEPDLSDSEDSEDAHSADDASKWS